MTSLSKTGVRRLAEAEAKIERGLSTFMEVGAALASIRDERLYRAEHDTFEAYCRNRWGFTDRRARQLMDAAQIGTTVPVSNEAQARSLSPVKDDPEEMQEVYAEAERRGDTTSGGLARVVAERHEPATATSGSDQPQATQGAAGPDDDEQATTPASSPAPKVAPPVPSTLVCPTCGGTGEVQAVAS